MKKIEYENSKCIDLSNEFITYHNNAYYTSEYVWGGVNITPMLSDVDVDTDVIDRMTMPSEYNNCILNTFFDLDGDLRNTVLINYFFDDIFKEIISHLINKYPSISVRTYIKINRIYYDYENCKFIVKYFNYTISTPQWDAE